MVESGEKIEVPKGLSKEARKLYEDICREFVVETAPAKLLLLTACHSLDRLRSAQKELKKHGITTAGRYGQRIGNPALGVERTARAHLMQALAKIGFTAEID
jgi:P27 family predicted phage terminase small subunit